MQATTILNKQAGSLSTGSSGSEMGILIKTTQSLLGDKQFTIYYDENSGGLSCQVRYRNQKNSDQLLPLAGIPNEIFKKRSVNGWKHFFSSMHFTLEKGINGLYNRVQVRPSLVGGMKPKIPFEQGLALGSVIRGDLLARAEEVNSTKSMIEHLSTRGSKIEQEIQVLSGKLASLDRKEKRTLADTTMKSYFDSQIKSLEKEAEELPEQIRSEIAGLEQLEAASKEGASSMSTTLETPFNFDVTETAVAERGFNSLHHFSNYIDVEESEERTQDKMNQATSASQVGLDLQAAGLKLGVSHSWANEAVKRVGDIKSQGYASKILFINSLVTTRYVRYLRNPTFDPDKLRVIFDKMQSSDQKELSQAGIKVDAKGKKSIYLLTECVMGGSFSAIVTYYKTDASNRSLQDSKTGSSRSTHASFGYSGILGRVGKGSLAFDDSRMKEKTLHDDRVQNQANLNVTIEFIVQGVITQLAGETVTRDKIKFEKQNFKNYGFQAANSAGSTSERQEKMNQGLHDAINTIEGTSSEQQEMHIHTPSSVMKAYDEFARQINEDPSCGVPLGFNYTILTEERIASLLGLGSKGKEKEKESEKVKS